MLWIEDAVSGHRLFTGGYDGTILEWDIASGDVKASLTSFGGAIWSLASHTVAGGMKGVQNVTCVRAL